MAGRISQPKKECAFKKKRKCKKEGKRKEKKNQKKEGKERIDESLSVKSFPILFEKRR